MSEPGTVVAVAHPMALTELACKPQDVLRAAALIQEVMAAVMKDGEHYGIVPGTEKRDREGNITGGKKSLFKSGAEKLCFTFGLSNKLDIKVDNLPSGHRDYTIVCNLFDRAGSLRGQGVGSCSTMESKYRYRGAVGHACPKCGAQSVKRGSANYGGGWYCDAKKDGCGAKFKGGSAEDAALAKLPIVRAENPDPADQYNTVLKMAKKRALVDAVLTATAASDCFAQDLEDLEDGIEAADAKDAAAKPAAPQAARTATTQPVETPTAPNAEPDRKAETKPASIELAHARVLWSDLEKVEKGLGTMILGRICALHGAKEPKDIAPEKLKAFGNDIDAMIKESPARIEDMLSTWEQAMKNGEA